MESKAARQRRVVKLLELLHQTYPGATCELTHENPYQLLVATILSAQCTDRRVNMVTPALFEKYPSAASLAVADPTELEGMIQSTGFFRNKARNLLGMARGVVEQYGGEVPDDMERLRVLPGVGRKTANVVLGTAFRKEEGVVVDTHVGRISQLLDLTRETDAEKIERDLMALVPRSEWTNFSHLLIHHGRNICVARRPRCEECPLYDYCPGHRPLHEVNAPRRSSAIGGAPRGQGRTSAVKAGKAATKAGRLAAKAGKAEKAGKATTKPSGPAAKTGQRGRRPSA